MKSFQASLKSGSKTADTQRKAQSAIDKAAKKGVIHKNKAARQKKQLAAAYKAAGGKRPSSKRPTAKKASPAKKVAPAKKTAAKKTTVKKPAVKKK